MSKDKINKEVIIIGAGPAGLTAAFEFLKNSDFNPIIFEESDAIGGISKTVKYKGNRIDIGGHRFFSKSSTVMNWWQSIFPLQGKPAYDDLILQRNIPKTESAIVFDLKEKKEKKVDVPDPEKDDGVMLYRNRLSRIFFLRKFFDYPISLSFSTIKNLGLGKVIKVGFSYVFSRIFPIKNEKTLEEFFINRFGKELYKIFFKDYTEKVWGVSCSEITAEWGSQRIKGLSIRKAIIHAIKNMFTKDKTLEQKNVETSLIQQFTYPKFGPGQLWEAVAGQIKTAGGTINMNKKVVGIKLEENRINSVLVEDAKSGKTEEKFADYFISTMPIKDLITAMGDVVPKNVKEVAEGLVYRDFITVGLLLDKLKIKNYSKIKTVNEIVPDNWIYIQERDVKVGRLQIFNNWSPYLIQDHDKVWIGMEYFCFEGDDMWEMSDKDFIDFAIDELVKIDIIDKENVIDAVRIKVKKTYPAYFGTYDKFDVIKNYLDKISNLYLVGRNGMHRYNNMDHSMLSAMTAVDNIINGIETKDNIWNVNAEKEYHEEK